MGDVVELTTMVLGPYWLTVPSDVVVVVVEVLAQGAAVCARAMLAVNSITPKKVRPLRLRIVFFISILSCYAVT